VHAYEGSGRFRYGIVEIGSGCTIGAGTGIGPMLIEDGRARCRDDIVPLHGQGPGGVRRRIQSAPRQASRGAVPTHEAVEKGPPSGNASEPGSSLPI